MDTIPVQQNATTIAEETARFFQKVYGWMCAGLVISGVTAYGIAMSPDLTAVILGDSLVFYALLIAELALVVGLVYYMPKISAQTAMFLFLLYSFVTGLTLSVIFLVYTIGSIGQVFFIAAAMFGLMSLYGYFTKSDLTGVGQVLIMGLIGLVVASVINLFFQSDTASWFLSIIGVVIFTGLTAYDTQKIRAMNVLGNEGTPEDTKEAILGALNLYLDFINLFLSLLRLFGKRR